MGFQDEKVDKNTFLEQLSFLNVQEGIKNYVGNQALYRQGLRYYLRDEKRKDIREAYEACDWSKYELLVHGVKGVSYTIGAMEVGDFAKSLEMAEKRGDFDFIKDNNDKFLKIYGELLEKIEGIGN